MVQVLSWLYSTSENSSDREMGVRRLGVAILGLVVVAAVLVAFHRGPASALSANVSLVPSRSSEYATYCSDDCEAVGCPHRTPQALARLL